MASTMATSGSCLLKAGDGVSTVFKESDADTNWDLLMGMAESTVCVISRYNWMDVYATLNTDVKGIITDTVSNLAAIYAITYDMSGYTSRTEAEDIINVLRDAALRNMSILRDKKFQDFINGA